MDAVAHWTMSENLCSLPTTSSGSSTTQFRFTEEQRKILIEYWQKGMQSCSKGMTTVIKDCAHNVKCTEEQVKHWVNAQQKRQKKTTSSVAVTDNDTSQVVKICRSRKRTAFQVFCHEMSSSVSGEGSSKMTELSKKWSNLMDSEKKEWKDKAASGISSITCTPESKKKMIHELISITQENLSSLACLGVEGYAVLLNVSNSDCRILHGSDTAQEFIEAEEEKGHALDDTFFKYMCGQSYMQKKKKKTNTYDEMLSAVRGGLKQKYRDATGKGRVPYGDLSNLGCDVSGLPDGVELKQPNKYSSSELRLLYKTIDHVKFLKIPNVNDQVIMNEQSSV